MGLLILCIIGAVVGAKICIAMDEPKLGCYFFSAMIGLAIVAPLSPSPIGGYNKEGTVVAEYKLAPISGDTYVNVTSNSTVEKTYKYNVSSENSTTHPGSFTTKGISITNRDEVMVSSVDIPTLFIIKKTPKYPWTSYVQSKYEYYISVPGGQSAIKES